MLRTVFSAGAMAMFASAAFAHATLEQQEVKAGATAKITLRVPHGCQGEATHRVQLTLPDGFYAAQPMPKAGWDLTTETGDYARPYNNHGTEMTSGLRQVIWSGGNLADGWYDEFTVRGTFGADIAPGTVMFFPAVQLCANGTADWTDTSGAHDVPNPAPQVTVVAGDMAHGHGHGGHGGHDGMADHAAAQTEWTLGDLTITAPFSRATLPNAPVAGGFLTITNTGTEDDRLIGGSTAVADHVEVHEMAMEGDVMKMRQLADGLAVPAGATVVLKPGGFHMMFMGLKQPLVEGETVTVTLEFEKAGSVDVPLAIGALNAREHDGHMGHGGMKGEDHGHNMHGTGHVPSHDAPDHFDQASIHGDAARIEALLRATFETGEATLSLNPVLIAGDHALVGWVQDGRGGRAMLGRGDDGLWGLNLCGGDLLKGAAAFRELGVPEAEAEVLAAEQLAAEAELPEATLAALDSFGDTVRFD